MDALKILSEIRNRECIILGLYKELAKENEGLTASMLNVSFDIVKKLKSSSADLSDNLVRCFNANTSSLFTLSATKITASPDRHDSKSATHDTVMRIKAQERKVVLEMRDICIKFPAIAAGCCGLSVEQIDSMVQCSASEVMEFCYQIKEPILKLRVGKEKGFGELLKVGSKPCFNTFGWMIDKVAV